jgi:hypothetical protein
MFRLEPYIIKVFCFKKIILKYIRDWDTQRLSLIYATYLHFRKGGNQFIDILISSLTLRIGELELQSIFVLFNQVHSLDLKRIFLISNSKSSDRKDIDFSNIQKVAATTLISKIKYWKFSPTELCTILNGFFEAKISNPYLFS